MYKEDLALNDLQWLICHKTKTKPIFLSFEHLYADLTKFSQKLPFSYYVLSFCL